MYYNSRLYEKARVDHIQEMRDNNPSTYLCETSKKSKSEKLKMYVKTPEHCAALSKAAKGKQRRLGAVLSNESKDKIRKATREWFENNAVSAETRQKLSLASTGRIHSLASITQMKNSAISRKRFTCPICNKENLDGGNFSQHMTRAHAWSKNQAAEFKFDKG